MTEQSMSKADFEKKAAKYNKIRSSVHVVHFIIAGSAVAAIFLEGRPERVAEAVTAQLACALFLLTAILSTIGTRIFAQQEQFSSATMKSHFLIEEMFKLTDILQSAEDRNDAGEVMKATSQRIMPEKSGALYVFNNSRDRLDLVKYWGDDENFHPAEFITPSNCWALKRGKPHFNGDDSHALHCQHHNNALSTIEVPMIARGQIHGLMVLSAKDEGEAESEQMMRIAGTLSDCMSLALANISLREELRAQSLRDPLTGLYNRRYMEDALDRYLNLGDRNGSSTSIIMMDLDHFKKLNDEHGHAKGDSVLRDVGASMVNALRPTDVVARIGGEEFVIILPECTLEDAEIKAEVLRKRIEGLSEAHAAKVTASFGIATVPDNATGRQDVLPMADAALYRAKHDGRNCVRVSHTINHQPNKSIEFSLKLDPKKTEENLAA